MESLKSAKRAEVLSHVYIGKGLMPRVQQSLMSLARRVIPGLSSISSANAGIIFPDAVGRVINGSRNFSFRLAALIYIYADLTILAKHHNVTRFMSPEYHRWNEIIKSPRYFIQR